MKVWDKGVDIKANIINFTVGDDHLLDMKLIEFDCIASKAHAKMLEKIGILTSDELKEANKGLDEIITKVKAGDFFIKQEEEDCHSAIENYLTSNYGDVGKKIHTGRSRNDQVVTALRLFEKSEISNLVAQIQSLKTTILEISNKSQNIAIPGYTHMRKAMPSSISMWLESFYEALNDDILCFEAVLNIIDKSPLGTAAGFGVPVFEIDREYTCLELGFKSLIENPIYAQLTRGKFEGNIINSCSQLMLTLNKLATDMIMFSMTEFNFLTLPVDQCTGSSIMPQKVNPDVLELIRAKYHDVLGEEFKVKGVVSNLISGYNRDVQLTKKSVITAFNITMNSLVIMNSFIKEIKINKKCCEKAMSKELFATEKVNELVKKGVSFRNAYQIVAKEFTE